jgi:hypothetical protein
MPMTKQMSFMHSQVKGAQIVPSCQGWRQGLESEDLRHHITSGSFTTS